MRYELISRYWGVDHPIKHAGGAVYPISGFECSGVWASMRLRTPSLGKMWVWL